MAKKKSAGKGSKGKKGGASNSDPSEPSRIELVSAPSRTQAQTGRIGLGLILAFPLGWSPLTDAFAGRGPYELAMAKFLLVVAACVVGITTIGRLLDMAPTGPSTKKESGDTAPGVSTDGAEPADSLPFSATDR